MPQAMQGKEVISQALKWSWVLAASLALLTSLATFDGQPNSDADLLLGYAMLTLSFPLGLVIAAALSLLGQLAFATTGHVFTTGYVSITAVWLAFSIVGYTQWFVLLPWLWRKWKGNLPIS
jgi:hypothetical protein